MIGWYLTRLLYKNGQIFNKVTSLSSRVANTCIHWRRNQGGARGHVPPHFSEWRAKICLCPPPTFRPRIWGCAPPHFVTFLRRWHTKSTARPTSTFYPSKMGQKRKCLSLSWHEGSDHPASQGRQEAQARHRRRAWDSCQQLINHTEK